MDVFVIHNRMAYWDLGNPINNIPTYFPILISNSN